MINIDNNKAMGKLLIGFLVFFLLIMTAGVVVMILEGLTIRMIVLIITGLNGLIVTRLALSNIKVLRKLSESWQLLN